MNRRSRPTFTPEFKADVVRLCQQGDRSVAQIAKDLDLSDGAVRQWLRQAEADTSPSPTGALTSAEREELMLARRRLKRQDMEIAFLKKAAALFASETL